MAQADFDDFASQDRAELELEKDTLLAFGTIFLGAYLLMVAGAFHFIQGLAAVINNDFFVSRPGFDMQLDITTWGWIQMVVGALLGIVGMLLLTGSKWARLIAIGAVTLSAVGNFYSIPYFPIWSIVILTLDLVVLWALITRGKELASLAE